MTIANAWRSLQGRALNWLPLIGGDGPASGRYGTRAKVAILLAVSLLGVQQAAAQTCQPEKLYDIIISSFHQSVAQRTDGSWAGWGGNMGVLGGSGASGSGSSYVYTGNSVGRPLDIIDGSTWAQATNPFGGGAPLLLTAGSQTTTEQTIALTTKGLYAWGDTGAVLSTTVKATASAGVITVSGATNGLPPGVSPDDVAQIFATNKLLALVTKMDKGGEVWVLVNPSLGAGRFNLRGDGSSDAATDDAWHRVRTDASGNPVLQNVLAVRGQVGGANGGALMVHTNNGRLYAWGNTPYFGNSSAPTVTAYAAPMTLPQVGGIDITPKMIGVTGNSSPKNTMFVLSDAGTLYSVGANDQYQLGAGLTSAEETSWQTVQIGVAGGGASLVGEVDFFSVQEHDQGSTGGAAGALITRDGTVYTWGRNNGSMVGAPGGTGNNHVAKPNYVGGSTAEQKARLVEVGGHTTVFLPKSSPQFCYVGHQTEGSMGDGVISSATQSAFNCSATPVLNICGASGFDYGDAPKGYENGSGSNQAMHFYANGGSDPNDNPLFLGSKAPQQNDATPKNVVSGTKNVGEYGDYIAGPPVILEEDGIIATSENGGGAWSTAFTPGDELPTIPDTALAYSLQVRYTNTTKDSGGVDVAGTIHAWVDWNNDGIFQTSEYASAPAAANTTGGVATLDWTGLSGLADGYRYIRLRITTKTTGASVPYNSRFPAENVTVRTEGGLTEDSRSLGFAMDGEIEDHRVRVVKSGGADNVPPVAIDVITAPVGLGTAPQRLLLPATSNPAPMNGTDGADGTVVAYRIMTLPTNGTLYYLDGALPMPITSLPIGGLAVEATTELWYSGSDTATATFTFKAIDDDSDESNNTATYTIPKVLIDAVNDTATAVTSTASIATNVVGNDKSETYDTSGAVTGSPPYTVASFTQGTKGTVSCSAAGVCTYTPANPNLAGSDSYEYTICLTDAPTVCDKATVTVTLQAPTITPVNDVTNTQPGVAVDIPVVQNDRGDAALNPGSVMPTVTTTPTKGNVTCSTAGVCTYTPNSGQTGVDTFTYNVCLAAPNGGVCGEALVTVNIGSTGLVATDDVTNTQPGTPKTVPVRQNDTAMGGGTIDPTSVVKTSDPANGSVTCTAGECVYTPNGGFTGTDQFTYKVCLAAPNATVCDEAQVTVNVGTAGVVATDDVTNTQPGTPKTVPVRQNDTAMGGGTIDPTSVVKTSDPANGTVTCTAGECVYTPNGGFTGTDQFTYKVCLAAPNATVCDEAQVTVNVGTAGVVATDDVTNTQPGTPKTVPVRQNDTATGGGTIDPTSVAKTSDPANGTVTCTAGECVYTPNGGFTGTDQFTYKVCLAAPNATVCDEAQVTVEVSAAGGPVLDASDDTASTTTGTGVNVPVTINDVVTGGGTIDPNSVVSTSGPASGTVDCTTTPGVCRYTPNPGFTGEDSFTYRVCLQTPAAICDEAVVRVKVGAPSLAAIPTLSEWGVMILSALMGLFMAGTYRRRMC